MHIELCFGGYMKAFLISLAVLTVSTLALAQDAVTGLKTFPVTKAELAPGHFEQEFKSGNLTVNYDDMTVTLVLDRPFHCPEGLICAQVMPEPKIVQLPIVSIEEGNCGATLIRAEKDARNRDGIFEQINVVDNTTMVCRILLPYKGTAVYTTSAFDHVLGTEVAQSSKLVLDGRAPKFNF
jgi:hypothetical protein